MIEITTDLEYLRTYKAASTEVLSVQGDLFVTTFLIYCRLTFLIAYHSIISIFPVFSKPVTELIRLIFSAQRNLDSNIKLQQWSLLSSRLCAVIVTRERMLESWDDSDVRTPQKYAIRTCTNRNKSRD